MNHATPATQPPMMQPFASWNPTRGIWETQLDLYGLDGAVLGDLLDLRLDARWIGLPVSLVGALLTTDSASSSSPTARFRTPLATDSTRGGETLDQVRARRGTIALSHQIIDFALHGPAGSPTRRRESETLWSLIDGLFNAGDATPTPSPAGNTSQDAQHPPQALLNDADGPRPAPAFVEWLMGLPTGWVTDGELDAQTVDHRLRQRRAATTGCVCADQCCPAGERGGPLTPTEGCEDHGRERSYARLCGLNQASSAVCV